MAVSDQVTLGAFVVMQQDISELKGLMGRIVDALTKFAIVEERQQQAATGQERTLGRLEAMERRQHEADINSATNRDHAERLVRLENAAREAHVESERQKAKFSAITWSMRLVWTGGAAVAAAVAWIFRNTPWITS